MSPPGGQCLVDTETIQFSKEIIVLHAIIDIYNLYKTTLYVLKLC